MRTSIRGDSKKIKGERLKSVRELEVKNKIKIITFGI